MPRTMLEIHDGRIPAMRGITALDESPLVLQREGRGSRKQVFESADGIPSATLVTNSPARRKIFTNS